MNGSKLSAVVLLLALISLAETTNGAVVLFDVTWEGVLPVGGTTPVAAAVSGQTATLPTAVKHASSLFMYLVTNDQDPGSGTTAPGTALRMHDKTSLGSTYVEFRLHDDDSRDVGWFDISLDVLASSSSEDNPNKVRFLLLDANRNIGAVLLNPNDKTVSFVQYNPSGQATSSVAMGAYELGTVFNLRMKLNLDTDTVDVWVDGDWRGTADLPTGAAFQAFRPDTGASDDLNWNIIDNVKIVVPEPGSLAVIGSGLALIWPSRRDARPRR